VPKVSQQHRDARREQILDAALACFATRGFQRTSMADIIAESGLSAGAIYGHFEGKQQLAVAVAQRILGHRMGEIEDSLTAGDLPAPSRILRTMMDGLRGEVRDPGLLVQLWGEAVTDPAISGVIGPTFVRVRAVMGGYLARWAGERLGMAPDAAAGWADEVMPVFLGIGQGYIVQNALLPGFDADAYFRGVADLLDRL